jgi:hypothetical protein
MYRVKRERRATSGRRALGRGNTLATNAAPDTSDVSANPDDSDDLDAGERI